jgi:iron complex transport system substrate-binding protein
MRRTSLVLVFTLVFGLLVTGVARAQDTRTVIDGLGREVTLEGTPQNVVTTIASTTEIVLDLGLDERLVGVPDLTQYLSYVPELQAKAEDKTKVGGFKLSMEKIASLSPDLVVLDASAQQGTIDKVKNLGATVYAAGSKDMDAVQETILELGYLTGTLERAEKIVGKMVYKQFRLAEAIDELDRKKKVFYTVSPQMYTPGGNTFVGQVLEMAGLDNVFSDVSGFKPVSTEEIVQRNPELIIGTEDMGLSEEGLMKEIGSNNVEAIKEENVMLLPSEDASLLNQPGTKIVDGAINLFENIYGEKVDLG